MNLLNLLSTSFLLKGITNSVAFGTSVGITVSLNVTLGFCNGFATIGISTLLFLVMFGISVSLIFVSFFCGEVTSNSGVARCFSFIVGCFEAVLNTLVICFKAK